MTKKMILTIAIMAGLLSIFCIVKASIERDALMMGVAVWNLISCKWLMESWAKL